MQLAVLIAACVLTGCRTAAQKPGIDTIEALTNVTVIDGTGAPPRANQTILISKGRIREIVPATRRLPDGVRRYDLSGKYVIPGLIDAHVHLGTQPRAPGVMAAILRAVFLGGVTSVRDMGSQLEIVRPLAMQGAQDSIPMPRVRYSAIMAGSGMWFDGERARFFAGAHPVGHSPTVRRVDDTTTSPSSYPTRSELALRRSSCTTR